MMYARSDCTLRTRIPFDLQKALAGELGGVETDKAQ